MEYLPFGETLADEHLNSINSPFKYNGKELDEETGNYYYGARYYDPKWSIFISVDPLIDKTMSAYGYCSNNPINRIDPNGLTDYKVNSKGEVSQVGDANDNPDRILKTRRDGSVKHYGDGIFGFLTKKSKRGLAKVSVDNVAKGILSDGQNFSTEEGALIELGEGANSANRSEVFEFMLDLSEHLNIEIGATLYSDSESSVSSDPTHIGIASIKRNSISSSNSTFSIDSYKARNNLSEKSFNEIGRAHTHPTGSIFKTYQPSDVDIINMQTRQNGINGLRHFLIYRPQNRRSVKPFTTFEYTNSKLSDFNYPTN
ncbi:MAG: RHS repeat-associated core domain-containing protein, partial [Campylobacterales bacterium]|nr:RHS repeat-associated core domain-containing protein [Campylobacterales bacterium]